MKRNLKVLYFVILGVLCLYVSTGPATATTFLNAWAGLNSSSTVGNVSGSGSIEFDPNFGNTIDLDMVLTCVTGVSGYCEAEVDYGFNVYGPASVTVEVSGRSTDPGASGTTSLSSSSARWSVSGNSVVMTPFSVGAPLAYAPFSGEFTITLAQGGVLNLEDTSLDFVGGPESEPAPEPGSALLLGAGVVCLAFLRRKIHA